MHHQPFKFIHFIVEGTSIGQKDCSSKYQYSGNRHLIFRERHVRVSSNEYFKFARGAVGLTDTLNLVLIYRHLLNNIL